MNSDGAPRIERDGDVVRITMTRAARRNSLARDHLTQLLCAVTEVGRSDATGIVLAGEGPVFSAGHDLADVAGRSLPEVRSLLGLCTDLMQAIQDVPQVVLARVHGLATAAGCQLVASCDLAVASVVAQFATPGVNIGLFCSTPMVALSRNVARKHAMELLLTGEMVSAADAYRMGLVNRVTPEGEAMHEARRLALLIASKSPLTLKIGKRAFYEQLEMGLADAYRHASAVMVENMLARDAEEGIGAFIDKREAKWEGR
jgi:enoyl-CoA hydratase/carnithine racemase